MIWRRIRREPRKPADRSFVVVGAASGFGSALLGSVGPLTAPFFLAYGLMRAAYIGDRGCRCLGHARREAGDVRDGNMLTSTVLLFGVVLTPATIAGAWVGERIVGRINDRVFVILVEVGLVVAGILFVVGF